MTSQYRAELFLAADALVGEGPYVDRAMNTLLWVDMLRGEVHRTDLFTAADTVTVVSSFVGAAIPTAGSSDDAVALFDGFGVVRNGTAELLSPVVAAPDLRLNDAKADAAGRLWAGSTQVDFAASQGSLYRWDGIEARRMACGFTLPNGMGWSPDGTRMYLVDSIPGRVHSGAFDAETGELGLLDTIADVDGGLPDGLAVDADGCLWIAIWGGGVVQRYSPSGRLIGRVAVPIEQPSSCAFGPDGTLWITSARAGLSEGALAAQPLSGSIFVADVGVDGAAVYEFGGLP